MQNDNNSQIPEAPQSPNTTQPQPSVQVPAAAPLPEVQVATIDDFIKIQMAVGTVLEVSAHPESKKLLILRVDMGEPEPRVILTGLQAYYPNFVEYFANKKFIFVKNLAPRRMAGMVSHGMLLSTMSSGTPIPVLAPEGAVAGDSLS